MSEQIQNQQQQAEKWFRELRNQMVGAIQKVDGSTFQEKEWQRPGGGGGLMSILKGEVFEKVGVNFSKVYGKFPKQFKKKIPGANKDPRFWASGISVVMHMKNPLIPAMHFNTRYISTTYDWFGGGMDVTPSKKDENEKKEFHKILKNMCDRHNKNYYSKYKKWCDEYFYLPHRKEPRGLGGIFFDYKKENFEKDFKFVIDVGVTFELIFENIIKKK